LRTLVGIGDLLSPTIPLLVENRPKMVRGNCMDRGGFQQFCNDFTDPVNIPGLIMSPVELRWAVARQYCNPHATGGVLCAGARPME